MKHVRKSVLLWYSPQEMFDLVADVLPYPQFLPWCEKAEVLQRHEDGVTARLTLAYMGVRHAFTTRNEHHSGQNHPNGQDLKKVLVRLVDGPFSVLDGQWLFKPIPRPGHEVPACKIEFELRYAFASKALEAVVSPVFDRIAGTLVDSFVQRAEAVHGAR